MTDYETAIWFEDAFGVDVEDEVKYEACQALLEYAYYQMFELKPKWDDYVTYFQECLYHQCDPLTYEDWINDNKRNE